MQYSNSRTKILFQLYLRDQMLLAIYRSLPLDFYEVIVDEDEAQIN